MTSLADTASNDASQKRLRYLLNEVTVQEQRCNLRCSYCLNFENELKGGKPWVPLENVDLRPGGLGLQRLREVLARCKEADAPILRFSGGEFLSIAGALDVVEESAESWHRIQILTNATFLDEDNVRRLAAVAGINLCCSMDGHTPELNYLRVKRRDVAQRIVDGTLRAIGAGIPVEIYMVLTTLNARSLYEFAERLAGISRTSDVRLFPFPVRGQPAASIGIGADMNDLADLQRVIRDHSVLSEVLPPRGYLVDLLEFYERGGHRTTLCRVPLAYLQVFDDGVVASCSNCWSEQIGNLFRSTEEAFKMVGRAKIHKLFLRNPPRVPFCRKCFTPFDVVNSFFRGESTLEELAQIDLYSSERVRNRLSELKHHWDSRAVEAVWA